MLAAVDDPLRAARRLVREAKNEGGHDNITVIVLRLDQAADDAVPAAEAATAALPVAGAEAATVALPALDDETTGDLDLSPEAGDAEGAGAPGYADEGAGGADDGDDGGATGDGGAEDAAESDVAATRDDAETDVAATGDGAAGDDVAAGAPPAPRRRRRRLWLAAAVAVLLLFCVAAGAVASDVYFVGEHDGMVSVYRGLPVSVAGIRLNGLYLQTTMPLVAVAPGVRARVERHDLHRKAAALALARQAQAVP